MVAPSTQTRRASGRDEFRGRNNGLLEQAPWGTGKIGGGPSAPSPEPGNAPGCRDGEASVHAQGPERVPERPVGNAVSPWASEVIFTNLVGESHYASGFRAIFRERGLTLNEEGKELPDASAHLAPDPGNPYDQTAVAVWVSGQHVGYLPKDTAAEYFPALDELAAEGKHVCIGARIWAAAYRDGDFRASGSLQLPRVRACSPSINFQRNRRSSYLPGGSRSR